MGDGQWSDGCAQAERGCVIWVSGEPAPQRIVKKVNFPGAEQEIISWLAEQFPTPGVPVRSRVSEVGRVDHGGVRVCAEQERSWLASKPAGEDDRLPRLFDPIAGARRCVI